jgi:hypothetical protein
MADRRTLFFPHQPQSSDKRLLHVTKSLPFRTGVGLKLFSGMNIARKIA